MLLLSIDGTQWLTQWQTRRRDMMETLAAQFENEAMRQLAFYRLRSLS